MMSITFFNNFFWELLSILSLTMFGLFYIIERISTEKYPMTRLLGLFLVTSAAVVLWVRLKLVSTPYQINGIVDLILLAAMVCVSIHFLILILRATAIPFSRTWEKYIFYLALSAIGAYGIYLYFFGMPAQFAHLALIVDYWIRPTWIVVFLILLAQMRIQR
ncbi:TPA: hypothetical protein DIC20_00585 [Candidatus Dependentiae bacterium]|nr:MAG: hypothetical protein US03_C0002G0035 [candidate division TM6 bacterium GW2011_GWF2_36_131]KKQ03469.1 MAG: hypothetical protein US13_C0002G0035 [candidate division TM6 bacterium GW2011_GWE2_36_25]KKQ20257.1 MAG: hypothetical protein US32_C0001G0154 [candidate division TM6 bacterium GW2011_GWA2_36_9]HBR70797.1 hypothetical protein [Candidatus Dependentiae bacterium]HCU00182.1 hypothetical protein [Candidatus Dependentiae bacterium]